MNEEKDLKNEEEQKNVEELKKESNTQKTDDSFFFENQDEEITLVNYEDRESTGFAGFVQKIHSLLRGFIDTFEKMSMGTIILLVLTGLLTFASLLAQQALDPMVSENLTKTGVNTNYFNIAVSVITPIIQYLGLLIVFSLTKKDMTPVPNSKEKNTRIGVYLVTTSLVALLISAIPMKIIVGILGFIVGIITYAAVFYDRIEDERLFAVGIKSGIVSILIGILMGIIVAVVVMGVVMSMMS